MEELAGEVEAEVEEDSEVEEVSGLPDSEEVDEDVLPLG